MGAGRINHIGHILNRLFKAGLLSCPSSQVMLSLLLLNKLAPWLCAAAPAAGSIRATILDKFSLPSWLVCTSLSLAEFSISRSRSDRLSNSSTAGALCQDLSNLVGRLLYSSPAPSALCFSLSSWKLTLPESNVRSSAELATACWPICWTSGFSSNWIWGASCTGSKPGVSWRICQIRLICSNVCSALAPPGASLTANPTRSRSAYVTLYKHFTWEIYTLDNLRPSYYGWKSPVRKTESLASD